VGSGAAALLLFSRLNSIDPRHSTLELARLVLERGADLNAGFLCRGLNPALTVLTGAEYSQQPGSVDFLRGWGESVTIP